MFENLFIKSLFFFIINIIIFYLVNLLILKKNFLIDLKNNSSHKRLINSDIVPISGGIMILFNLFLFNYFSLLNYLLITCIFIIGLFADIQN